MDNIELSPKRGASSRAYAVVPQQEHGLPSGFPPSYDQSSGTMHLDYKKSSASYGYSISQSDSIPDIVISQEPPNKLPPKSYVQLPTQMRLWIHVAHAAAFILGLGLPLTVFLPVIFGTPDEYFAVGDTACNQISSQGWFSGGSFSVILNIDIAYGNLSFGVAKLIDLVWDIFISHGGQILLGWITYRVHNAALLRIMESKLVSYDLYATMTLSWASTWSLRPLAKTFFTNLGFRRKLLLFWLALSIIWVSVWPTITNAMTGYVAKDNTLVRLEDNSGYANYSEIATNDNLAFQWIWYDRNPDPNNLTSVPIWEGPLLIESGPNVTLWATLQKVVNEYNYPVTLLSNFSIPGLQYNESSETFCYVSYYFRNQTYSYSWFQDPDNVQCVANGSYQWGFSSGVFLIFICLNAVWVTITYGVWVHMNRKSELCRKHRSLGKYRAAVDMVEAITADLGNDICAYSDYELESMLMRRPGIKYAVTHGKGSELAHIGLISEHDGERLRLNFGELYGGLGEKKSRWY